MAAVMSSRGGWVVDNATIGGGGQCKALLSLRRITTAMVGATGEGWRNNDITPLEGGDCGRGGVPVFTVGNVENRQIVY